MHQVKAPECRAICASDSCDFHVRSHSVALSGTHPRAVVYSFPVLSVVIVAEIVVDAVGTHRDQARVYLARAVLGFPLRKGSRHRS